MTDKKYPTYSYDKYEGHENEEIISLVNDLNDALANVEYYEKEIAKIRDNCVHEYLFSAKGPYKDFYECIKCGHGTWH